MLPILAEPAAVNELSLLSRLMAGAKEFQAGSNINILIYRSSAWD